jgi:hypothetical protein
MCVTQESKTSDNHVKVKPVLPEKLFIPDTVCWHKVIEVRGSDISAITSKVIKVEADKIIKDVKKREQLRFR